MTQSQIAKRLEKVEADLKALKVRPPPSHPADVLARIHNTFDNDSAFREAARLGKQWRMGKRSSPNKSKSKRK